MARELEFDGWWEGAACYTCDCCGKNVRFRFDSEEEANDFKTQREYLKGKGWISTKVNGYFKDFCGYDCRDKYIRNNTI